GGARRQVRLLLVAALILTAVLLLASFASAESPVPNELGRVMILEYHKIDYPEERWTRTPENFRRDLETLYAHGYRLVALGDLLDGRITLPAGTTPVVLTFDDSSPGQFRYVEANAEVEIDPKSAVGILEAFAREHPKDVGWALSGSSKGIAYRHDAILQVAGGPAPSPFARAFDPVRLPRIQAIESELRHWLGYFEHHPGERFVSDGDPAVVTVPAGRRDRVRSDLGGLRVFER